MISLVISGPASWHALCGRGASLAPAATETIGAAVIPCLIDVVVGGGVETSFARVVTRVGACNSTVRPRTQCFLYDRLRAAGNIEEEIENSALKKNIDTHIAI